MRLPLFLLLTGRQCEKGIESVYATEARLEVDTDLVAENGGRVPGDLCPVRGVRELAGERTAGLFSRPAVDRKSMLPL